MADDLTLKVGVEADATDAVRDMRAAADAAASLADSFREIATVAVNAAKALTKAEQGVTGTARSSKQAQQAVQGTTQSLKEQATAANNLANSLSKVNSAQATLRSPGIHTPGTGSTRVSTALPAGRADLGVGVDKASRESINATNAAREAAIRIQQAQQKSIRETVLANIAETKTWREKNGVLKDTGALTPKVGDSFRTLGGAVKDTDLHVQSMRDSLFTARFALHDISNATGVAGAAFLAFNALTVKAAADYETAMAAIQRTSGATTSQMEVIRDQFVDLAQTVPAGFQNIAQIGELAGQLNIPTQRIASFTETVAQFTSSTDVAVGSAAEAFGRLDALLPDVQGNYEALGSSILNVGVNSVATESSIISTTTQIAAAGAQARFTADEVIGLAASYASLGIAPEAARGSTIRIFAEIRQAAAEGGGALDEFARIAGMSAEQFQSAWNTGDTSDLFIEFLKGLQTEGTNAETALRNLGITGVRDINALLRLSQNVDVVTQSFGYANAGFDEATQLATAFGITSETLNARLDLLGQSFQALFAELGASGTGPIKEFVNLLIDMIGAFTELARNPVAQWIAIFGGLFTLIAGGTLILVSLIARIGALRIAMRTTNIELRAMSVGMQAAGTSATSLQGRILAAGIAMTQFKNILRGLMVGTAITAGITLIIAGVEAIGNATKSAGDKAKDAFGDLQGLSSALQKDTQAYEETGKAMGFVEGKLTTISSKSADWVVEVERATGAQTHLAGESDRTTESIKNQTYAIGENTAALIAQMLADDKVITGAIKRNQVLAGFGAPTADVTGLISASVKNDTKAALAIIEDYEAQVDAFIKNADRGGQTDAEVAAIVALRGQLEALKSAYDLTTGALSEAAAQGQINQVVNEALGVSALGAGTGMAEMGEEALTSADKLSVLRDAVSMAFGDLTGIMDWTASIETLFGGLAESGVTSFSIVGAVGQANMQNLQEAIVTTIAAGEAMGYSAVDSVGALFVELQRQGINTATLMASLANIPGIGTAGKNQISGMLGGSGLAPQATQLSTILSGVAENAKKAAAAIGGGGGGGGGGGVGGAAKKAAAEIRTLVDYASDLEGVFSRAFDLRFSSQSAMDEITSGWIDMREAIDDARKAIEEAQRTIAGLQTDNNTLSYFLGVANDYGDTLRAAEIAQEIADNNAKIADEQKKVTEEGDKLNRSLTGNSKAAIENRDTITGLIRNYETLVASYAESGMSQADLAAKTAELRAEFLAQASQMGYSATEVEKYAAAFDDMSLAIARVPRNVTIEANINAAMTALAEFEARAARAGQNAANSIRSGGGGGYNIPAPTIPDFASIGADSARRWKIGWNSQTNTFQTRDAATGQWIKTNMNIFKTGGYTGGAGRSDIAGLVHGQEYVINAENTSRLGLGFLNALNSGATPAPAMPGTMMVELSPRDRALLAAAGNVTLNIDGKAVGTATNSANFVSTQRGSV